MAMMNREPISLANIEIENSGDIFSSSNIQNSQTNINSPELVRNNSNNNHLALPVTPPLSNNQRATAAKKNDSSCSPSKSDLSKSYRFIERKNSILFCPIGKEDFKKNVDLLALKKLVEDNQNPSPVNSPTRARLKSDKFLNMRRRRYSSIKKADSRMFLLDEEENLMAEMNPQFRIRARQMSLITQQKQNKLNPQVRRISLLGSLGQPRAQHRGSIEIRSINQIQKLEQLHRKQGNFRKRTKTMQAPNNIEDSELDIPKVNKLTQSRISGNISSENNSPENNMLSPASLKPFPVRTNQNFHISPEFTNTPQRKGDVEAVNDNSSVLGGMSLLSEDYDRRVDKLEMLIQKDKTLTSVKPCIICSDTIPDCVFEPCGHGGMCYICCDSLLQHKDTCPFCRIVRILSKSFLF